MSRLRRRNVRLSLRLPRFSLIIRVILDAEPRNSSTSRRTQAIAMIAADIPKLERPVATSSVPGAAACASLASVGDVASAPAQAARLMQKRWIIASGYVYSTRSEEHTSELQSRENLVCRLLLEKKNNS